MKFQDGQYAVEVSEAFSNNGVQVYVYSSGGSGTINMDERRLTEMRNWINRQLLKIKKQKSSTKKS